MPAKIAKNNTSIEVKLVGRLDMEASIQVGEEIEKVLTGEILSVTFDMSELQYLSSSGIRVLVSAAKEMHNRGGKIDVVNYNPSIKKILDVTDFFSICG